jgi:hypothetical protein
MQDFLSINLGHLITIAVLLVTVTTNFTMLRSGIVRLGERMQPVEDELKKLREVVIVSARQEERMTAMDQRMLAQGKRFDDLYSLVMKRIINEN